MPEQNKNLWAPWRMQYIRSLSESAAGQGCFLCHYWNDPDGDEANHVVWRGEHAFVVMNRFPYTNGHLMIAVSRHEGDLTVLGDREVNELMTFVSRGVNR